MCVYGCVFAVQLHAEVCYAECQLQRAALTFLQVLQHANLLLTYRNWTVFWYICVFNITLQPRFHIIQVFKTVNLRKCPLSSYICGTTSNPSTWNSLIPSYFFIFAGWEHGEFYQRRDQSEKQLPNLQVSNKKQSLYLVDVSGLCTLSVY